MAIWRTIHIENNKKIERYHDTEEAARQFWKAKTAAEHFHPVLNGKGLSYELRAQKLVDLIDSYEIKIAEIDSHIQEFVPHK